MTIDGLLKFFWDGIEVTKENGFGRHSTTLQTSNMRMWNTMFSPLKLLERDERRRVGWIIDVDHAGGHDLLVELDHVGPDPGKVVLSGLSVFFPAKYTVCMDAKACLKELGTAVDGAELRNSNVLQLKCLKADPSMLTPQSTCRKWRNCLEEGGSGHVTRLIEILEAAGVGGPTATSLATTHKLSIKSAGDQLCPVDNGMHETWRCKGDPMLVWKQGSKVTWGNLEKGFHTTLDSCMRKCQADKTCKVLVYSRRQGRCTKLEGNCDQLKDSVTTVKSFVKRASCPTTPIKPPFAGHFERPEQVARCIDPEISDPEAWDCDCHEEMLHLCHEISNEHNVTGFSTSACIRAQLCQHSKVCKAWKDTHCDEMLTAEIVHLMIAHRELVADQTQDEPTQISALQKRGLLSSPTTIRHVSRLEDAALSKRCK
eukprot:gnl/TRDRNA2_/TRDRNA2_170732_c0_seq2.p1 gnl/TRDRNA2_/TRDRNA2_170732_c0~~gnl/TRDRNA2_/TRDRNA2_170732_c0_seq2.p1  ORF type:complete len:427 (-),score=39.62 gnl/TRDRNA2_/TRDRNA2_170732_c0_seq2:186-1466(-)